MAFAGTPGAIKLWPPVGDFSARGITPASAAAALQSAGYASEGLALAVKHKLPERLLLALASAAGAKEERAVWTAPVSLAGLKFPGLPGVDLDWLKYVPWVVAGGVALYLLPFFVKRKG